MCVCLIINLNSSQFLPNIYVYIHTNVRSYLIVNYFYFKFSKTSTKHDLKEHWNGTRIRVLHKNHLLSIHITLLANLLVIFSPKKNSNMARTTSSGRGNSKFPGQFRLLIWSNSTFHSFWYAVTYPPLRGNICS